jgi:hypothetical protein
MPIGTDFSIASNGDIRYIGAAHGAAGAGYYTGIELHRWIEGLAAGASSSGDDNMDITDNTPTARSTDNIITINAPYNLDATAIEHLYDCSIIQAGGDTIWDGIVNYGTEGIHIEILQNGALIANDFWNTIPNGETTEGLNRDVAAGISHRFLVLVRSGGADIDGRRLLGMNREFGYTYGEFPINGSTRGNNVFALKHEPDLNNTTIAATVAGWNTITNTEGYQAIDVDGDTTPEYYYSQWNRDIYTINQFYERMKWLTRRGTVSTLYGLSGGVFRGITHEITITPGAGTWVEPESVSWPGGTGQLFAVNNTTGGSTTKMWIQLLTGVAPTNGQTITGNGGATGVCSGTPTNRALKTPFVGQSTGAAIIGSYGLGIQVADLTANDKLFDLTNTQRVPPNIVAFVTSGLVVGEDYLLIGPKGVGDEFEFDQLELDTTLSGAAETSVVVTTNILVDTPLTGWLRVETDSGRRKKVTYTSWSVDTFTITAADFSTDNATAGNDVMISYMDKLADATSMSFSATYSGSDRSLFVRDRDGGVSPTKTFESSATLGSSGGTISVIRTPDV